MVRIKHRYVVLEVERTSKLDSFKFDFQPFHASEDEISSALKHMVCEMHGDYGLGVVAPGLRVKYLNSVTRVIVVRVKHGEAHTFLASTLTFINKICKESIVLNTLYTGASIRHCFTFLKKRQKRKLESVLKILQSEGKKGKLRLSASELKEEIMKIRTEIRM